MATKKGKKSAAAEGGKTKGSKPPKPPKRPKLPQVGGAAPASPIYVGSGDPSALTAIGTDVEGVTLFIDLGAGTDRAAMVTALQAFAANLTAGNCFIVMNKGPRKKDDC